MVACNKIFRGCQATATLEGMLFTHLLLPTDGSPCSAKAIDEGLNLARALAARVTLLAVTEPYASFVHTTDCCLYTAT